jgi:serine/threonine-protein kinase
MPDQHHLELPSRIGKYELQEFLGGGMSHVYRAVDTVLGRTVAVKILTIEGVADSETQARFLLEARMASNISHENVIAVYDFGQEQNRPFIVMEFLRGQSLRSAIKNNQTGDLAQKLNIALQVGRALEYIHSKKIIHRDIKPENIHLDASGKAKLMDFGIAKTEGMSLTRAGFTLGTPYYMAPEQVLGQPLTGQVDIYAFGVMLFELLSGMKPISGDTVERIFNQILYEPLNLEPLRQAGVPQPIFDLVSRCTAKQPAQRPANFTEVCAELQRVLEALTGGSLATGRAAIPDPKRTHMPTQSSPVPVPQPGPTPSAPAIPTPQPLPTGGRPVSTPPPMPAQVAPAAGPMEELPAFVTKLPPALQTQAGLMLLAAGAVALVFFLLYFLLRLAAIV